jgi:hypothetical protein
VRVWVGNGPATDQVADVVSVDGMRAIPGHHHLFVDQRPERQLGGEVEQFTAPKVLSDTVSSSHAA